MTITPQEPHVKVTIHEMYREQQETNKLLARVAVGVEGLQDLPERVRALELQAARQAEMIKEVKAAQSLAKGALISAIVAIGTTTINFILGK